MRYEKTKAVFGTTFLLGGLVTTKTLASRDSVYNVPAPNLLGTPIIDPKVCAKTPDLQHPAQDVKLYRVTQTITTKDIAAAAPGFAAEQKVICINAVAHIKQELAEYQEGEKRDIPGLRRHTAFIPSTAGTTTALIRSGLRSR